MKKFIIGALGVICSLFSVSQVSASQEFSAIETQVFEMQKDLVNDLQEFLRLDADTSIRQKGDFSLRFSGDTPGSSGSMNLKIKNYTTIFDAKSKNSEVRLSGTFDMMDRGTRYEYKVIDEENFSYDTIKKPYFSQFSVDFNVTILAEPNGSVYFRIDSLDARSGGDREMEMDFNLKFMEMKKYVGKMYKIPVSSESMTSFDPEKIIASFYLLEKHPLFVVDSLENGEYILGLNKKTLEILDWEDFLSDDTQMSFKQDGGKNMLRMSFEEDPKNNFLLLTEENGIMSLDLRAKSQYTRSSFALSLSPTNFSLNMRQGSISLRSSWKNNAFVLVLKNNPRQRYAYDMPYEFTIRGTHLADGSNTNLTMAINQKNIGKFTIKKSNNSYEYFLNFDLSSLAMQYMLEAAGKYEEEFGDFTVTLPTIFEILDENIF